MTSNLKTIFSLAILLLLIGGSLSGPLAANRPAKAADSPAPVVSQAIRYDISPPLRTLAETAPAASRPDALNRPLAPGFTLQAESSADAALQSINGLTAMPALLKNFDGLGNSAGVIPPDTQGEIGYDPATGKKYYVQWVNVQYGIWDVSGSTPVKLLGPLDGSTLFSGFGGACETTNDGDPITLFDPIAKRWLMTQFALPYYPNGPFYQCIAVSKTGDPTGQYYRYAFVWKNAAGAATMNDYPKFGVWPDGYYMSANQFGSGDGCSSGWCGAGVAAFERTQMLSGLPARMIYFDLTSSDWGGMLPADLDGLEQPPSGSPNYFAEVHASEWDGSPDEIQVYAFHADWANTAASSFTSQGRLAAAAFDGNLCGFSQACIPQPGVTQKLDSLADRTMYRLAYRNFGGYASMVTNLTVDAGGDRAAPRWFELRRPTGGSWSIYQQGTYSPDATHRWMGSIAQDHMGNIAIGYSVSSSSVYPGIRYAGRLADDPPGQLTQGESAILNGTASQTAASSGYRWGDYSMMSVDPLDDCTFWYTNEYTSGGMAWKTRIAAFKFPNCSIATGQIAGTVTDQASGAPIAGAQVTASASGISELAVTNAAGGYSLSVPPGSYTVQAGAAGYQAAGITGVTVAANTTTTRNLALTPLPRYTISGAVRDAGGGWPLYARVMISADPLPPLAPYDDFWTGAVDGSFSVTLPAGSYSVQVRPWAAGYPDTTFTLVVSANGTQDFLLTPDPYTCSAPGYTSSGTATLFSSGFEGMATLPAGGWAQLATSGNTAMWTIPTSSNLPTAAPHGGARMALLNSYSAASGDANRLYRTSGVDLSGVNNARLSFWFFHYQGIYTGNDQVQPQVSTNGGASWTNLGDPVLREASNGGWTQYTIDLSAYTGAGMSSVRLAFLGLSGYGYSMLLDDVSITSGGCSANPGGLVVGTIRDQNTGLPLSGASAGYTGASAASGSDGFYTLFAPAGARSISAAKSLYTTGSATVNVPLGGGVQQDFNLAAGQLTTTGADALWVSLPPGGSTALSFTLHNTGSAAAAYTFNEAVRSPAASAAANIGVPPSYRAMADATMAIRHGVFRFPRGFTYLDDAPQADRRLNVLLLCADAAPCGPLDTILVGYPDIGRVDSWPAALAGRTPSLAELAGYDAVIAWSNFAFLEPARLGDVLADYVDGGGRLVLAAFDWSPPESGGLAGRLVEQGYTPLIGTGQANRSAVSQLGAFDAAHPILYGVSQAADFYRDRTTLNPGAYLLAGWADGEPFVALKGRVAAINAYLGRGYAWTGDLGKIVHNTLVHLAAPQAGLSWLSESPADGGLPAGAQQAVTLNFDAAGLATGSYRGTLSIGHDTPYIVNSLPVTLTVTTATTGLLQGRVLGWDVCGTNRFALAGADLQISPGSLSLVSAADGSYTSYLAGGSYTVQVSASGYLPASVVVLLQNGLTTTQDFSLTSTQPCRRIYLPLAVRP